MRLPGAVSESQRASRLPAAFAPVAISNGTATSTFINISISPESCNAGGSVLEAEAEEDASFIRLGSALEILAVEQVFDGKGSRERLVDLVGDLGVGYEVGIV